MFSSLFRTKQNRIYLDHAATTPLDPVVWEKMQTMYRDHYVNPGAMYREAVTAGQFVEQARQQVAGLLSVPPQEITFTHGGSESVNLALQGTIQAWHQKFGKQTDFIPEVIVSEIEHAAVRDSMRRLEERGLVKLILVPVDEDGILEVEALEGMLSVRTILVSVMYANNEIGVIQPVREVAKILRHHRKYRTETEYPYLHTDAIQATQFLDMHAARLGADFISMSASKIYGPKTMGALWMRRGVNWEPLIVGGKQEGGRRPGTVDVAGVVGLGVAVERVRVVRDQETKRLRVLQERFFKGIDQLTQDFSRVVIINGSREATHRLPHNVHVGVEGVLSERLVLELDARGIAVSAVAACVEHDTASHVTLAMYGAHDPRANYGTIRITMGRSTGKFEVDATLAALRQVLEKLDAEKELMRTTT